MELSCENVLPSITLLQFRTNVNMRRIRPVSKWMSMGQEPDNICLRAKFKGLGS